MPLWQVCCSFACRYVEKRNLDIQGYDKDSQNYTPDVEGRQSAKSLPSVVPDMEGHVARLGVLPVDG